MRNCLLSEIRSAIFLAYADRYIVILKSGLWSFQTEEFYIALLSLENMLKVPEFGGKMRRILSTFRARKVTLDFLVLLEFP